MNDQTWKLTGRDRTMYTEDLDTARLFMLAQGGPNIFYQPVERIEADTAEGRVIESAIAYLSADHDIDRGIAHQWADGDCMVYLWIDGRPIDISVVRGGTSEIAVSGGADSLSDTVRDVLEYVSRMEPMAGRCECGSYHGRWNDEIEAYECGCCGATVIEAAPVVSFDEPIEF